MNDKNEQITFEDWLLLAMLMTYTAIFIWKMPQ